MIRFAAAVSLAALAVSSCAPEPEPPAGPVLIAVTAETGFEPAPESLYVRYGVASPLKGHDFAALSALTQHGVNGDFPAGTDPRRFEGPRLSALLAAAGEEGAGARLTALDGYQIVVEPERIDAFEPVVAIRADGEPLGVGGLGPAILVWPRLDDSRLAGANDDDWIWGVFAIEPVSPGG